MAAWVSSCSPQSGPAPAEDTLTSGRIQVVCAPEALALMDRERAAFEALYPKAHIGLESGSSLEAVRRLFAAQSDLAVITRELEPEERAAASRGRLGLEGYRFARDGLVVIVHPGNRVRNMALDDLRRVYLGQVRRWSEIGGVDRAIVPVIQRPELDIMAYFTQQVMNGEAVTAQSVYAASDSGAFDYVSRHEDAIGFASLAWAKAGVRALRVSALSGLPYRSPDAETVYNGDYPLSRSYNFYVRAEGPPLANGFITFVTSRDGQRLVHEAGLVPTAVPVRFVRRSPMQSSH